MIALAAELVAERIAERLPTAPARREYSELEPTPYEQIIRGANPGAGAEYVYTAPGGVALLPLSVMCTVTTDATVADRAVAVEYRDGTGERYMVAGAPVTVSAGSVQPFCWYAHAGTVAWPVEDVVLAPLPQQHVYEGCSLAIRVYNGQAGDVIDKIRVSARFVPEWSGEPLLELKESATETA